MWKKILPIVFLLALVAWGVYDYTQDHVNSESQSEEEQSSDSAEKQGTGIEEGDTAPDFTLKNLQGEHLKLSDFRGKNVLLNFWASWCGPCEVEMPEMQRYYEDHKDEDFTILAVNVTESEASISNVSSFVNDYGLTFPVVLDVESDAANTYEASRLPTSYFIDKQGVIRHQVIGPVNTDMIGKYIERMN